MQDNLIVFPEPPPGDRVQPVIQTLPVSLTSLIGRGQEVQTIKALLSRPDVRLLTLTGTPGVGKTCLALEVARDLAHDFADGVHVVSLAPLSDPAFVIPTIAHSIGLSESGSQPVLELLKTSQRDKQRLLLLDNFEQVIEASTLLVALLEACPDLKLLVTSREVLRLRGEHQFTVPPLTLPDPRPLIGDQSFAHVPAVQLFLQRAQAIRSDFQLTPHNAAIIAEICLRLDGLPLAIELAAARVKVLSVQALLRRLQHRFQLLTAGARDLPERHQTLRNTIQWSYDLLSEEEQCLFRRLSVFVGGCTLEAVEAVCATPGERTAHVMDGVASLLDKSLLHQTGQEREVGPRFVLLETIREFGSECRAEAGETEATQEAHAAYYLALAEEAEPHLKGPEQIRWFARLEQEHENLRTALSWLLRRARVEGQAEEARRQAERALRLCVALSWFWEWYEYFREGWSFLEQALTMRMGVERSLQARALRCAGGLIRGLLDLERAEALTQESLTLYRELGDTVGRADALLLQGKIAWLRSQYALARSQLEEAEVLFQRAGDTWKRGHCVIELARIATKQGRFDRAHALLGESLAFYQALGDQQYIAWVLYHQACVLFESQSDLSRAATLAEQSLAIYREANATSCSVFPLRLLAEIHLVQGKQTRARELAEECRAIGRERGFVGFEEFITLARVLASQDDHTAARTLYLEGLAQLRTIGDKVFTAACLEGLGAGEASQGQLTWAVRLWGAAEAVRQHIGTPLPSVYRAEYEHSVAAARAQLGEKPFAATWAEGRTLTPEQALAAVEGQPKRPTQAPVARPAAAPPDGLTAREVEVLCLLAQGLTSAQIAEQLVISVVTVNFHVRSIYSKLGVTSRAAATRYALEHHLV